MINLTKRFVVISKTWMSVFRAILSNTLGTDLNTTSIDLIKKQVDNNISVMDGLEYRFLPVISDTEITDERIVEYNASRLSMYLRDYLYIFKAMESEFDNYLNEVIAGEREIITKAISGSITKDIDEKHDTTTTYNTTKQDDRNVTDNEMTEQAPIDASFDITTPNAKSKNIIEDGKTSTKTGSDTDNYTAKDKHTTTDNSSEDINNIKVSPDTALKFYEVIEKFNIPSIVSKCFKRIVYEYNYSI